MSTGKRRAKDVIVPGWNEQVKELHVEARHAYLTWRDVGKPRQGDVFTTMKLSRSKLKYALRKCKRDKETVIADNIAEKLCQKDSRDFWKNIKQMTNKKVKLPTNMDGVHGDNDIVSMWKQHYATIYIIIRDCTRVGAFPRAFCVPNTVALASLTLQVVYWAIH